MYSEFNLFGSIKCVDKLNLVEPHPVMNQTLLFHPNHTKNVLFRPLWVSRHAVSFSFICQGFDMSISETCRHADTIEVNWILF